MAVTVWSLDMEVSVAQSETEEETVSGILQSPHPVPNPRQPLPSP